MEGNRKSALPWWKVYLAGWFALGLAYLIILGVFVNITGRTLVTTWLANIAYPSIASVLVVWFTVRVLIEQKAHVQVVAHTVFGIAYSAIWLLVAFRLFQLFEGTFAGDWSAPDWQSPVVAWQLLQGLAIYCVVATSTYAYWALQRLEGVQRESSRPQSPTRLYAKDQDGLAPVALNEITLARTIDGMTYVFVGPRRLESRLTLGELERILCRRTFVRVHRTAIVNLDHIELVESAGNGRQTVRMTNGAVLETSRNGTSELKSRFAVV